MGGLTAALLTLAAGGWLLLPGLVPHPEGAPEGSPAVEAGRTLPAGDRAGPAAPAGGPSREASPEAVPRPAEEDRALDPTATAAGAAGGDPGGPPAPSIRELAVGGTVYLPEVRAHVTVELVTLLGKEMVKVTVIPDGHDGQPQSGFPGSVLRFQTGDETVIVDLLSVDRAVGTVRLRARRSDP